jgi:hypothetical protein
MNRVLRYVDDLMINQPFDSDEYTNDMDGGKLDIKTGLGGFPPIFVCEKKLSNQSPFEEDNNSKRSYARGTQSVSIKSIMEQRQEIAENRQQIKPFLNISRISKKQSNTSNIDTPGTRIVSKKSIMDQKNKSTKKNN